jgi:hypothetical protein
MRNLSPPMLVCVSHIASARQSVDDEAAAFLLDGMTVTEWSPHDDAYRRGTSSVTGCTQGNSEPWAGHASEAIPRPTGDEPSGISGLEMS